MNTNDSSPNGALRLKRLLKAAELRSYAVQPTHRIVNFVGRQREWAFVVGLSPDWLNATTVVCELPKEPGMRARLLEWAMVTNRSMSLAKFSSFGANLALELDYRAEHLDAQILGNLIHFLVSVAEEHYAQVFRIINGEDVLESLERSIKRDAAS